MGGKSRPVLPFLDQRSASLKWCFTMSIMRHMPSGFAMLCSFQISGYYHVLPCISMYPKLTTESLILTYQPFFFQIRSQFKDIQLILSFISRIFAALQCAAYWHLLMFRFLSTELSDVAQGDFQLILWVGES